MKEQPSSPPLKAGGTVACNGGAVGSSFRSAACLHLLVALVLTLAGLALLFMGFLLPPEGEIHSSVLIAFGEVSTFAGALFGVDYRYRRQREEG